MGDSIERPQIPEQVSGDQIPAISLIRYSPHWENSEKAIAITALDRMNEKIIEYNALIQAKGENNKAAALLLLQEIDYYANYLINGNNEYACIPSRSWYLTSGIAQQFLRFEKPVSHGLAAEMQFYTLSNEQLQKKMSSLDPAQLLVQAKSVGVDADTVESLGHKLQLESYQNSPESLRNYNILLQLRRSVLHTLMTTDNKNPDALQALLTEINSHLYAIIQAEPQLQQRYKQHEQYSGQFDVFYDSAQQKEVYEFLAALKTKNTGLISNASDEEVLAVYKSSPIFGTIEQKSTDREMIEAQKETWIKAGARTKEQLEALMPALLVDHDLKYLSAGNNITWILEHKISGDRILLRAAKDRPFNADDISILKKTPVAEYFTQEYEIIAGYDSNNGDDHTLTAIEYCSEGSLKSVRESMSDEDTSLIQQQACDILSQITDFCLKLTEENAYLADIKLSNFLAKKKDSGSYQVKISDLKAVAICAKGTDLRHLKEREIVSSATKDYAPLGWDLVYEVVECSPLPAHSAHKMGEIYYDSKTQQFSVLGHDGEFHEGKSAALGQKKNSAAVKALTSSMLFDMDKFMSYQVGLALYDFLTGLTIVLESDGGAEHNEARAKALEKLQQYKITGEFDYSAAVFQGPEGQALQALCTALLKTNPKERISLKEAAVKLNALKAINTQEWTYIKAKVMLQDAMEQYKKHNEQFNSDPNFMQNYKAMQTFLLEVAEAKTVTQDVGFLAHALEAEALRLRTWLQHAEAKPGAVEHFYPHYAKSLLNEGFQADLRSCKHTLALMSSSNVIESRPLLQEITAIHDSLETKMSEFLKAHHNDVASTPAIEFAKVFDTSAALKSYVESLNSHVGDMQSEDLLEIKERLSTLTQSATNEELAQNLRKEAMYIQYAFSYRKKDEEQNIPSHLISLRQGLIHHFFENHQGVTDNVSADLEVYLDTFFEVQNSDDPKKSLIGREQRYEEKYNDKEYGKAYTEALESNKQIVALYTKFLGEDEDDPVVAQMTQLRVEMKEAYKSGLVSAQGSAETLHKVNLELANSISYLAGPKLLPFKPVHKEEEWAQLRADNVNTASPKKKWAHRVLMGVGMSLALVLVVGTGGVAAAPVLAANIASAVSPTIKDSAVGLITSSSIAARAKRVMRSSKKENENAAHLFNTAATIADKVVQNPVISPNKPVAPHILTASHSGSLFHESGSGPAGPHKKDDDSEGRTDSGGHIDPHKGG